MEPITLSVNKREKIGTSGAKAVRYQKRIPAVLYGKNIEPISLSVDPEELVKTIDTPYKRNTLLLLEIDGQKYEAVIRGIQVDPVKGNMLHADFWAIEHGAEIEFSVPLRLTGQSEGVKLGGFLFQLRRALNVKCTIDNLPEAIELDVTKMLIGEKLSVSDLVVAEGIKVDHPGNTVLVQVKSARGAALDLGEEEEDEEGEEGEEGAEGEGEEKSEGGEEAAKE